MTFCEAYKPENGQKSQVPLLQELRPNGYLVNLIVKKKKQYLKILAIVGVLKSVKMR